MKKFYYFTKMVLTGVHTQVYKHPSSRNQKAKMTHKEKEIKFTIEELLQLHLALGNCWGGSDWQDHLTKKEVKTFESAWKKIRNNIL